MGHPVSFGEEDAANSRSEREFYARFRGAAYMAASAASVCAMQRKIELDPHRVVEPFGAAPVALADAELEAMNVRGANQVRCAPGWCRRVEAKLDTDVTRDVSQRELARGHVAATAQRPD